VRAVAGCLQRGVSYHGLHESHTSCVQTPQETRPLAFAHWEQLDYTANAGKEART
jgi:hypothetical protein